MKEKLIRVTALVPEDLHKKFRIALLHSGKPSQSAFLVERIRRLVGQIPLDVLSGPISPEQVVGTEISEPQVPQPEIAS